MSQETGNSFLDMGRTVQHPRAPGADAYAAMIAAALRKELRSTCRVIKTAMRWTGASERTVKLWLAGQVGPNGQHLIGLIRNSDDVFDGLLALTHRRSGSSSDKVRKRLLIIARLTQQILDA